MNRNSSTGHPPKIAEWVLGWLLPRDEFDTSRGDFEEVYRQIATDRGEFRARWWYRLQVIRVFPDRLYAKSYWTLTMLRSYLRIALRNLRRHIGFSFINLTGLTIGLATFLLIALFVRDQLGYDRFHDDADSLYRIIRSTVSRDDVRGTSSYMPFNLADRLESDFPGIEETVRFMPESRLIVRRPDSGGEEYYEDGLLLTESSFFDVFSFRLIRGDRATVLDRPDSIVLTERLARKYFGERDALGSTLELENDHLVEVTGIVEDPPAQSSIRFSMLAPLDAPYGRRTRIKRFNPSDWSPNAYPTYVRLSETTSPDDMAQRIQEYLSASLTGDAADFLTMRDSTDTAFGLEPITDTYLMSEANNRLGPIGELRYLYIFGTVAVLILLVAAVNYMNLATARSVRRAREVGLRKVFGAYRRQVAGQFFGEALLISLLAFPLAVLLVAAALPTFNGLVDTDIQIEWMDSAGLLLAALLFTLGVAILAGSYPAIYLSRFRPIAALRERVFPGSSSFRLRQALVIFQFAVSTGLIIGTVLIQRQLDYVRTVDLGLEKEQMLVVYLWGSPVVDSASEFQQAVLEQPYVSDAALSSGVPMRQQAGFFHIPNEKENDLEVDNILTVDDAFIETYEMRLKEGRTFESVLSDSEDIVPVILNETAERTLRSLGEGPVLGGRYRLSGVNAEVIGVVHDFHTSSLHETVAPAMLRPAPASGSNMYYLSIRLDTDDIRSSMEDLSSVWEKFAPDHPMESFFLDEIYDAMYRAEDRLGNIFYLFTGIGLVIACLGLYGLAAFAAEQRTREIGIRKVLGASPGAILRLLSRDFMALVLAGVVLSVPVAWLGTSRWLEDFAYRVSIPVWIFVACGIGAMGIALIAISYQSLRAASLDPAEALRHE